jgi:hypothetical protein
MAYASTIRVVKGDTLPELTLSLKDSNTFPSDTFPDAGAYEAEVEFTKSNGDIQTVVDLIKFNVRDDFD